MEKDVAKFIVWIEEELQVVDSRLADLQNEVDRLNDRKKILEKSLNELRSDIDDYYNVHYKR